ncbi:MAG: hypothetical protein MJZ14_06840 [Paludibacteraceae bacterium]|nr:hypothetical protein [Paludibacteraceae bacterium]
MAMPGRKYERKSGEDYRYGFQGQDKEKELWGGEASFFKYRISDNRLGRFFSVDPLSSKFPWNSSYAFSENRVIDGVELEGLEVYFKGANPRKGFKQFAGLASKDLRLSMGDDGSVEVTQMTMGPLRETDQKILEITTNKKIAIKVLCNNGIFANNSFIIGGQFLGSKKNISVTSGESRVYATQQVSVDQTEKLDRRTNSLPGTFILHEVSEAFEGAAITLFSSTCYSVGAAREEDPVAWKVYQQAHAAATPQPEVNIKYSVDEPQWTINVSSGSQKIQNVHIFIEYTDKKSRSRQEELGTADYDIVKNYLFQLDEGNKQNKSDNNGNNNP